MDERMRPAGAHFSLACLCVLCAVWLRYMPRASLCGTNALCCVSPGWGAAAWRPPTAAHACMLVAGTQLGHAAVRRKCFTPAGADAGQGRSGGLCLSMRKRA